MAATTLEQRIRTQIHKAKVAKLFQSAEKYGVIKRGWSCIDYMREATDNYGWESTCISGPKGSAKSCLMIQHGKALYGNIATTKKYIVTKRKQLLDHLELAINEEICIPWIGVDDIAALFPKSLYFTHRKLYSKLQASWETVRTVMSCFEFTCTLKHKVASFILEDITGDIKCYNRVKKIKSHYDYRRWLWLRNLKDPTTDIAKLISVEDIPFPLTPQALETDAELKAGKFIVGGITYVGADFFRNRACLTGVEEEDFKEYWNNRLGIARESFKDFKSILEEPTPKQAKLPRAEDTQDITPTTASEAGRLLRAKGVVKTSKLKEKIRELQEENERLKEKTGND